MAAEIGEFVTQDGKIYPVIKLLRSGGKNKFSMALGLSKCKLILENIDAIRKFVENTPKPTQSAPPLQAQSSQADDTLIV